MGDTKGIETKEIDQRDTTDFWRKWIVAAKAAAKNHWEISKAAWKEYEAEDSGDSYPIYWSSCKTMEPAYYARTPQTTNKRRFDVKDEDAGTACLINKHLADYLVENSNFDSVMMASVGDYTHADKTTTQVVYETEFMEVPLFQGVGADGIPFLALQDGTVYTGEVEDGEGGLVGKVADPETQKIFLSPACYDEVLHTPSAKSQAEIREIAYWFVMMKEDALKRFPKVDPQSVTWKKGSPSKEFRSTSKAGQTGEEFLEGWEIYDKVKKRVRWISEQYRDGFLDVKEDPYELRDFFPSPPFILGSKPSKSLYPMPAYKRLRKNIDTLTKQSEKLYELMDAIDPRALIDGTNKELLSILDQDCGKYIAITNMASLIEKGGLANLVQFLPVDKLVSSVSTFMQAEDSFKNTFFEHFGIPDILRGATDPVETAAAQQTAAAAAHDRFRFQKKQIRQLARDSIELMLDLAYKVFSNDTIKRIVGFDYMEPGHQERFDRALAILKDDQTRLIRIDIETDSMSFVDETLRAQQLGQAVQTVTQGIKDVAQTAKTDTKLARFGMQTLLSALEAFGTHGQQFQENTKRTLEQIIQEAEDAAKNPPPPQPTPEERKVAIEERRQTLEENKFQFEQQKAVTDNQLEVMKQNFQQQLDSALLNLQQVSEKFDEFERAELLKLEEYKVQLDEREKFIEEQRLAYEQQLEQFRVQTTPAASTQPAQPPVSINIDASKTTPVMPVIGGL